jgi:predicted amidohydrolase
VSDSGLIDSILPMDKLHVRLNEVTSSGDSVATTVDAQGNCLLPGFVDSHTHAVFAGDRCHEMKMKLAGATYVDVHKAGGGINYTVNAAFQVVLAFVAEFGGDAGRSDTLATHLNLNSAKVCWKD